MDHTRHTPFKGHCCPILGLLRRPFSLVPQPHPARPLQLIALPRIAPDLGLENLVARRHGVMGDINLVVHGLCVPDAAAHYFGVIGAYFDGQLLARLRISVVLQHFCDIDLSIRSIFRRYEETFLVRESHRRKITSEWCGADEPTWKHFVPATSAEVFEVVADCFLLAYMVVEARPSARGKFLGFLRNLVTPEAFEPSAKLVARDAFLGGSVRARTSVPTHRA